MISAVLRMYAALAAIAAPQNTAMRSSGSGCGSQRSASTMIPMITSSETKAIAA